MVWLAAVIHRTQMGCPVSDVPHAADASVGPSSEFIVSKMRSIVLTVASASRWTSLQRSSGAVSSSSKEVRKERISVSMSRRSRSISRLDGPLISPRPQDWFPK